MEKLKRGSKDLSEFKNNSAHKDALMGLLGIMCTASLPVCRPVTTLICKGEQPTVDQSEFWKEFSSLGVRDDLMQTSVVLTVEGQVVGVFCSTHSKRMPEEFRLAVETAGVAVQEALIPAPPEVTTSPRTSPKGNIPSSIAF